MNLAESGLSVLCLDRNSSAGQGCNKCAIGGIRATHGEPSKVSICLKSLEIFRTWEEVHGGDIEWRQGGYTYPAYDEETAELFRKTVPAQQSAGLNIDFVDADTISNLVPGIKKEGLLGGTYSPEDGSASPMRSCYEFQRYAETLGVQFRFRENVTGFLSESSRLTDVITNRETYSCGLVINCSGAFVNELTEQLGFVLPVYPESHEAGVTEPVEPFIKPMVVDIRKAPGSANYYFFQFITGQIIFCITPDPPIPGTSTLETSTFLPLVAPRMTGLVPRLANLKVRRTWRGPYPQTPDALPIIQQAGPDNHFLVAGMCGQGFMLGPGTGQLVARMVTGSITENDRKTLYPLRLDRQYTSEETLK